MDKLRKENEKLRTDLQATKEELSKLSKLVTDKSQDGTSQDGASSCPLSPGQRKSVDFISSQYDVIMEQMQSIKAKLNDLDHRSSELRLSIGEMQAYSYQYNMKIFGLPTLAERENSESTAKLCIQLFHSMGVKDVSMQDIDIAHLVPARKASSRPNPVICKFVRRQVKERVMAARKEVSKVAPSQLGYGDEVSLSRLGLYNHLSLLSQALLTEAKKVQQAKGFKFCWAKQGSIFLRMTDTSRIHKLNTFQDLQSLQTGEQ